MRFNVTQRADEGDFVLFKESGRQNIRQYKPQETLTVHRGSNARFSVLSPMSQISYMRANTAGQLCFHFGPDDY